MQVFKAFFKIARKRIKAIAMYLVIYMFIIIAFALTGNQTMEDNFKSTSLRVCIQDEDHSKASRALCDYLGELHEVMNDVPGKDEIADMLYYRYLDYVLIIPEGFEENLTAGKTEDLLRNLAIPGSNVGVFVSNQVSQYTRSVQLYLAGGYSLEDALSRTDENVKTLPEVRIYLPKVGETSENLKVFQFYQYLPYIFILILFVGMAPIITTQNEKDRKARTLCSSLPVTQRALELTVASALFALITWICFILLAIVFFREGVFTSNALLAMGNSFVFMIFTTLLTLLISQFSPGENVVNIAANIIGLGSSFLSGVFVPQSLLSEQVLAVAKFLPTYWYVCNNDMLSGMSDEPFDIGYYFQCIGIQLLFAVAVFAVTLSLTRIRKKA